MTTPLPEVTEHLLCKVETICKSGYAGYINELAATYEINTPARLSGFITAILTNSVGFRRRIELVKLMPCRAWRENKSKFTSHSHAVKCYRAGPEAMANAIYAGVNGNGDEESGDGWYFRGRGPLQIYGRDNYQLIADAFPDKDVMNNPDILCEDKFAIEAAMFYWQAKKFNERLDRIRILKFGEEYLVATEYNDDGTPVHVRNHRFERFKQLITDRQHCLSDFYDKFETGLRLLNQ